MKNIVVDVITLNILDVYYLYLNTNESLAN